jgi:secreted trypsin-like serine protease
VAGLFILVMSASLFARAEIDYGLFRPAIVNGEVVPNHMSDLRAMTPRILIIDSSEKIIYRSWCTGLLIAPEVVLTAAHCLDAEPQDLEIEVHFGDRVVAIKKFVVHPSYERLDNEKIFGHVMTKGGANDVALIFLAQPMNSITPALLPDQGYHIKDKTRVTMAGYGFIGPDEDNESGDLRYVEVPVKEISKGRLTLEGKKTSCHGDSGGPLLLQKGTRWMSIGVVSIGDCIEIATPMRTSHFSAWIQEQIEEFRSLLQI